MSAALRWRSSTRPQSSAYRAVPHDELQMWWAIRAAEALLRGRGLSSAVDALGEMLTTRQAKLDV
jgi:hypothetical protein